MREGPSARQAAFLVSQIRSSIDKYIVPTNSFHHGYFVQEVSFRTFQGQEAPPSKVETGGECFDSVKLPGDLY